MFCFAPSNLTFFSNFKLFFQATYFSKRQFAADCNYVRQHCSTLNVVCSPFVSVFKYLFCVQRGWVCPGSVGTLQALLQGWLCVSFFVCLANVPDLVRRSKSIECINVICFQLFSYSLKLLLFAQCQSICLLKAWFYSCQVNMFPISKNPIK